MGSIRFISLTLLLLMYFQTWVGATVSDRSDFISCDVVVYGSTSAGVVAALQVERMGKSVIIIEPGQHLGGMTSSGLGSTDAGSRNSIGGISFEFYRRLHVYYNGGSIDNRGMWRFEPHAAEDVFNEIVNEERIQVFFGERLDLDSGVNMDGGRIESIVMESGMEIEGEMFIDATYEGDLMALAGVTYTVGRESNDTYNETLNGVQTSSARYHNFNYEVDPWILPGFSEGRLLPGIHDDDPGVEGEGDERIQAYCFRLCTTNVPENRIPWREPAGYEPLRYELLLRYFDAGFNRLPLLVDYGIPNFKTDVNNLGGFSSDNIGMNYDYAEGDYETRRLIINDHKLYQMGFMWTLATHFRVPEHIREYMQDWGLAKDEFVDSGHWPHQLYIREARRMVSDYVMTERNCRGWETASDSVGMASYTMDSHNVQRYVDENGFARNEGDVQVRLSRPYPISYRSIIPSAGECGNLLVPVCLSASHIAFGSIRMEPVFMILGQSAGTAAVLAIDEGTDVQEVDYSELRDRLIEDGQILAWE